MDMTAPGRWMAGSAPPGVAIIGGGIGGLALCHALVKAGTAVELFEGSARPGGVIRSLQVGGHLLECGPQRGRLDGDTLALVQELGLAGEVLLADPTLRSFIYRRGELRAIPLSFSGIMGSDLLSLAGRARLLAEPLTRGPLTGETVADYLVRKCGPEAYEVVLGPLFGGLHGGDPGVMPMDHALEPLLRGMGVRRSLMVQLLRWRAARRQTPRAFSFRKGLEVLPSTLADVLADQVRLACPVVGILHDRDSGGYRLALAAGGEAGPFRDVVLTVPGEGAASLLEVVAPAAAVILARLSYNPLACVHLLAEADLHGFGYQVAHGEALETRGVSWNGSAFGRSGVHTAFLGGGRNPALVMRSDEELGDIAVSEFRAVTGLEAHPLAVTRTRMPAYTSSWRGLERMSLPAGLHLFANYQSRAGIPSRIRGACVLAGTLAAERRSGTAGRRASRGLSAPFPTAAG